MGIMTIFDAIITVFGIYMIASAMKMKKNGEISNVILTADESRRCHDKAGFIAFMYWREAVFGSVFILVGLFGLLNDFIISVKYLNVIGMVIFVAASVWFLREMSKARENYIS